MSLSQQYATDTQKEQNGVEMTMFDSPNADGTFPKFVIARMGGSNKAFIKAMEAATRPYRRQIEMKVMDQELAKKLYMEVFADTILKSWADIDLADVTGNEQDKGTKASFNKTSAIALMNRLPELYSLLESFSAEMANYRLAGLEDDAKN